MNKPLIRTKRTMINLDDFENHGRIPPQCIDIEIAILGMLINNTNHINMIVNMIKPEYFYKEPHQIIYQTIIDLYKDNIIPDTLILVQKLRDNNTLEECGGPTYISGLSKHILADTNIVNNALIIIEKYVLRELIILNSKCTRDAYENKDPFKLISELNSNLNLLVDKCRMLEQKNINQSMSKTIDAIINIHTNDDEYSKVWYPFNIPLIDKYSLVAPNNTLLIGGKSGSGKTRYLIFLMRELLKHNHEKISVKWYSMEDDAQKLIRCYLSPLVGLTDEQLEGKKYKMKQDDLDTLIAHKSMFLQYDVDIVEQARSMQDISMEYKAFVSKRPNRMNLLIIDNLMLLQDNASKDNQLKIDDSIARELYNIRNACHTNNINSYTIALHHFTDEQLDSAALKTAYRPREKHFKGSTRIRDASTQIILLNRFANYPDVIEAYPDMKKELEKLMTIDITKNRNGSTGLLRAFADMDYTNFHLI